MTTHCAGVKIEIDDLLCNFLHYQVRILLKSWSMGRNMCDTFTLEGSEHVFLLFPPENFARNRYINFKGLIRIDSY